MNLLRAVAVLLLAAVVAGCGSADPTEVRAPEEVAEAIDDGARLIDVRTPEEAAQGALPTAQLIDAGAAGFDDAVAALDAEASYVVYCASGRRAALAVERMREAGIDEVVNGGAYEELAADPDVRDGLAARAPAG
jgi:phage shock protein E